MSDLACADLVELASSYVDGELPEVTASAVRRHALSCPGCSEFIDQLIATSRLLRTLGGGRVFDHLTALDTSARR